jgi:hypothetical protein
VPWSAGAWRIYSGVDGHASMRRSRALRSRVLARSWALVERVPGAAGEEGGEGDLLEVDLLQQRAVWPGQGCQRTAELLLDLALDQQRLDGAPGGGRLLREGLLPGGPLVVVRSKTDRGAPGVAGPASFTDPSPAEALHQPEDVLLGQLLGDGPGDRLLPQHRQEQGAERQHKGSQVAFLLRWTPSSRQKSSQFTKWSTGWGRALQRPLEPPSWPLSRLSFSSPPAAPHGPAS